MITAALILSATLMICCGAMMAIWLLSDKPLVSVTVQVAAAPVSVQPPQVVLKARQVFQ